MKGKVLNFIIGVLVGAIIATIGFVIYEKNNKHKGPQGMNGGIPPQMMQQQNSNSSSEQDTPPALPNGEQPTGNQPSGEQTQNNSETTNTTSNS